MNEIPLSEYRGDPASIKRAPLGRSTMDLPDRKEQQRRASRAYHARKKREGWKLVRGKWVPPNGLSAACHNGNCRECYKLTCKCKCHGGKV